MTFNEFYESVVADFQMGGVSWGQAFMRALNRHLPELVDRVKDDALLNPDANPANLAEFLYLVRVELRAQHLNKPKGPTEGWGAIRPGDRKAHYYRDGTSLDRKVGSYSGPLEPDAGTSKDDCAACRKLLDKEKVKQPA